MAIEPINACDVFDLGRDHFFTQVNSILVDRYVDDPSIDIVINTKLLEYVKDPTSMRMIDNWMDKYRSYGWIVNRHLDKPHIYYVRKINC